MGLLSSFTEGASALSSVLTAEGDLIVGGVGGTPEALAIGAKNTEVISTGARARYARRRQVYVENYDGYVGDGVNDDTAAVQAAQDDAGETGLLVFPDNAIVLITDTITLPALRCAWAGVRAERGANSLAAAIGTYHSVRIMFRPVDTAKFLVSAWDGASNVGQIGPFHFRDLMFDLGDANGFEFGREDVDGDGVSDPIPAGNPTGPTQQRFVFGVRFERCAFDMTNLPRTLGPNGEISGDVRRAIWLTKAYEGVVQDCSFKGGWTHIRMWECDADTVRGIRSQTAHLPIDLESTGPSPQKKLEDIQIEGWMFTPIRMVSCQVNGNHLRLERLSSQYSADTARLDLVATADVTAGSATVTFSASMDDILFPGLSLIELTDGTNTDTALVDTVDGTAVTVKSDGFAFDWSAAAATVTRIHGYGPIKTGTFDVGLSNVSLASADDTPAFVMANSLGQVAIANAGQTVGSNGQNSLVVGNRFVGQAFMHAQMVFSGCSPMCIADPSHPLVTVSNWRPNHGAGLYSTNARPQGGHLADEQSLTRRAWLYTPKSGITSTSNMHDTRFLPVAGDGGSTQHVWGWAILAATNHRWDDATLPSEGGPLRIRVRARAQTTGGTLTVDGRGTSGVTTFMSPSLTTDWQTFEVVVPVPIQWTVADGRTTSTLVRVNFNATVDFYLAAAEIVDLDGGVAAANPDTSGATLTALETEVNELKAALRTAGILEA